MHAKHPYTYKCFFKKVVMGAEGGHRDGSLVNRTHYPCRGLRSGFQHPLGGTQLPVTRPYLERGGRKKERREKGRRKGGGRGEEEERERGGGGKRKAEMVQSCNSRC